MRIRADCSTGHLEPGCNSGDFEQQRNVEADPEKQTWLAKYATRQNSRAQLLQLAQNRKTSMAGYTTPTNLQGSAFGWYTSLPPNSVQTWKQLEERFHEQYHSEASEAGIADLAQVRKKRGETVAEYIQRFRDR
ncbi:hypothetical protein QYE76_039507 [Lolium multiflorum]|uniref:Retrotransposon gag domain-containing protein n=1 Tax=Lolium multiflorum TaxID=4521 RepID=A0AAD8TB94_LOLMU|nr:hypothetical protein QYE76_039507 [Lolium multiflorum]